MNRRSFLRSIITAIVCAAIRLLKRNNEPRIVDSPKAFGYTYDIMKLNADTT